MSATLLIALALVLVVCLMILSPWIAVGLMGIVSVGYFFARRSNVSDEMPKYSPPSLPTSPNSVEAERTYALDGAAIDGIAPADCVSTDIHTMDRPIDASTEQEHPDEVERRIREEWFPNSAPSFKEQQARDRRVHLNMRRGDRAASGKWTKADKAKAEIRRRKRERDIALALKPDPFMIVEAGPEDQRATNRAPFMDLQGQSKLWHRRAFQHGMRDTGNIASRLTNTDLA